MCVRVHDECERASCDAFAPTIEGASYNTLSQALRLSGHPLSHAHLRLKEAAVLKFLTLTAELMAERREMSKCSGWRLQWVR